MKRIALTVILIATSVLIFAQKSPLNFSTIAGFPEIVSTKISNDGRCVLYVVDKKSFGSSLFVCSSDNAFRKEISGAAGFFWDAYFSEDSRRVIFLKPGDSLCIMDLQTSMESCIPHCVSFKMPEEGNGEWLAYRLNNKELVLYNFFSNKKRQYPEVDGYTFSNTGKTLLIKNTYHLDGDITSTLQLVNLSNGKAASIWRGRGVDGIVFDQSETQLAFTAEYSSHSQSGTAIWYYQMGMDSARLCVDDKSRELESGFSISGTGLKFNPDGGKLFFKIRQKSEVRKPDIGIANIDIWTYKDEFLQSEQMAGLQSSGNKSYAAVIHLGNDKVVRLEQENDNPSFNYKLNDGGNDDYLLTGTGVNSWDTHHLSNKGPDLCLVSTKDGSRKCIKKEITNAEADFSPGGKYVYWYDQEKKAYFTYNLQSGVTSNISTKMDDPVFYEPSNYVATSAAYGPAVWLRNDEAILVYSKYDIWKLDPDGKRLPVCVTNGFGRRNRIILRYVYLNHISPFCKIEPPLERDATAILCGFNEVNKYNGFFKKKLDNSGDPIQLIMSPEIFYFPKESFVSFSTFLIKAKEADAYLLKRMSAIEYPNLQITKNFIEFRKISELDPQKAYNWLTAEIMRWTTFDGRPGQGILYKPENFDPQRKYPIIFYFYRQLSEGVNRFMIPELSSGPMDIPSFVSNGYLVFCPDILYTNGRIGESAYNYVVSAAEIMSQKPFIDSTKMGIQGHSFGGYEVNYLITRTGMFAAAASAAGYSDLISAAGIPTSMGNDWHSYIKSGPTQMGTSIWENKEAYIENSPVFGADKVTTPLLMMHNKRDPVVDWSSQGIGFFTGLRWLGKRVWLLQYENGSHTLFDDKDLLDYSLRLRQFFDHYLKNAPAPKWMTVGISAADKGILSGLELDTSGRVP